MTAKDAPSARDLVVAAAEALKQRKQEVDRLNVFPVPDGDTGTNMSLTMDAVLAELAKLPSDAPLPDLCAAVTHGSLMGARGNSGVILSQVLRGLCESVQAGSTIGPALVADALARSTTVAFQAVRKPVEGTMLTVLRDSAEGAAEAVARGEDMPAVLRSVTAAAFESVKHTPELLPVLKEAGVVDAGGYGLAILAEGFVAAAEGHAPRVVEMARPATLLAVTPADDWEDQEHLYCTEFLLYGDALDRDRVESWMAERGGSELVVGDAATLKVHVHTDDPAEVLAYATGLGEVAEVHINNMRRQAAARKEAIASEGPRKAWGFVAVAAGAGLAEILRSLGVDEVVSGGQTMNPSTAELLEAVARVPADTVVILPNNRNIVMAAQQAVGVADRTVAVVPTTSVPEAFSALLVFDESASAEENVAAMTEAAGAVRTGEVTRAIKDSAGKAGKIREGQFIGIADKEIEVVGDDLDDVAARLLDVLAPGGETLTILWGDDLDEPRGEALAAKLAAAHPELEVETHRGGQPLYPLIMSVE